MLGVSLLQADLAELKLGEHMSRRLLPLFIRAWMQSMPPQLSLGSDIWFNNILAPAGAGRSFFPNRGKNTDGSPRLLKPWQLFYKVKRLLHVQRENPQLYVSNS